MYKCISRSPTEWAVLHLDHTDSLDEQHAALAKDLRVAPKVGVAIRLDEGGDLYGGHAFCFLPLPPDSDESKTGLPFHVHGYYLPSDSRRSVRWPSGGLFHWSASEFPSYSPVRNWPNKPPRSDSQLFTAARW